MEQDSGIEGQAQKDKLWNWYKHPCKKIVIREIGAPEPAALEQLPDADAVMLHQGQAFQGMSKGIDQGKRPEQKASKIANEKHCKCLQNEAVECFPPWGGEKGVLPVGEKP